MPLFSNRSIANLLDELGDTLTAEKRKDILARLIRGGTQAIAAEWEVVIFNCLKRVGKIELIPKTHSQSDPDIIYTSRATGERVVVEVTAISDTGLHEKNPVRLFAERLHTYSTQRRVPGAFRYEIGYIKREGQIILGVPDRKRMAEFFRASPFLGLLHRIRNNPSEVHKLEFESREARSVITYCPGATIGGGGHIAHDVILSIEQKHIRARLDAKDKQIKRSGLSLPAIVVLCDAGCSALTMTSAVRGVLLGLKS